MQCSRRWAVFAALLFIGSLLAPVNVIGTKDVQNDAGSGRDAPDEPVPEVWIESGNAYGGLLDGVLDARDHYAFHAEAGDMVQVKANGPLGCYYVLDETGAEMDFSCTVGYTELTALSVTVPTTGTWYLLYTYVEPQAYAFSIGVNEAAPAPLPTSGLATSDGGAVAPVSPATQDDDHVVVAVVDTGINPYHAFFRAPGLQAHASTWLPDFPAGAQTVDLTLDAPTYADALAADNDTWHSLERSRYLAGGDAYDTSLYTFPGTRIVGAVSFSEYSDLVLGEGSIPVLDEHGHGTHSAGLAAGANLPAADGNVLIVMVEVGQSDFETGVRWAARQPWIDAISVSLGRVANAPAPESALGDKSGMEWATLEAAQNGKPIFMASGNGVSGTGLAPDHCTTYTSPYTGPSWVTRIGAAEPATGNPTYWHCLPVEAIARTDVPSPDAQTLAGASSAGGTSAATPNAAGHFAHLLLDARRADLPVDRKTVVTHLLHASEPAEPVVAVGAEPSLPVVSTLDQGYGLIDGDAVERARVTLAAGEPTPRPEMEAWAEGDRTLREALWGPGSATDGDESPAAMLQNDAGSGRDAPDGPDPAFLIESGVVYDAFQDGVSDTDDWYAFHGEAGDVVQAKAQGPLGCYYLVTPSGEELDFSCTIGYVQLTQLEVNLTETGVHYLHYGYLQPQHYRFSIGVNEPAPAPFPVLGDF